MNIDWSRLETFADEDDPEDMEWLKEMLTTLLENTASRLNELYLCIESKNYPDLQPLLHQIKGVAANFGLLKLQKAAANAEALAKDEEFEESIKEAQTLQEIWNEAKQELIGKYNL